MCNFISIVLVTGYWQGRQYLGLGPGAHSRINMSGVRHAMVNVPSPDQWMAQVEEHGHGVRRMTQVTPEDCLKELVATGLRTRAGVSRQDWTRISNNSTSFTRVLESLKNIETGFESSDADTIKLSDDKICVLDNILPHVFNVLDDINNDNANIAEDDNDEVECTDSCTGPMIKS